MSGAISVEASGEFSGNDGKWSTFPVQLGTPPQVVNLLPATSGQETWAITPHACEEYEYSCREGRGNLFNWTSSDTWAGKGTYKLDWAKEDEISLGTTSEEASGYFGFDTVALGWPGSRNVRVNHSIIAGTSSGPYLGQIGLSPRPTNFSNFTDQQPSILTLLKDSGHISSLSYGYTAGAFYRDEGKGVSGSLTLGGYDKSRFLANNMSFGFNLDTKRDLVVQLAGIYSGPDQNVENSTTTFLSKSIYPLISSSVPHMWLPEEVCSVFATQLGLHYDNQSNFYTVNQTAYETLQQLNQTFIFRFKTNTSDSLDISIPWKTFDLEFVPDGSSSSTRYFPIRRAVDPSDQYTLGRAFLQEAYIIVDYEHGNFSLHQARFGGEKDITALRPSATDAHPNNKTSGTPSAAIPERKSLTLQNFLAVGIILGVPLAILALYIVRNWRAKKKPESEASSAIQDVQEKPEMDGVDARFEAESRPMGPELDAGLRAELYGCETMPHLLDSANRVAELGNDSALHEASADSRTLSNAHARWGLSPSQ